MAIPGRRPVSITLVGWLFIVVGCGGIAMGAYRLYRDATGGSAALVGRAHSARDFSFVAASGVLAVAGGAYTLRGRQVGRWLLNVWMGFHVLISLMHSLSQLALHVAIFAVILFFLYRPSATDYFRRGAVASD